MAQAMTKLPATPSVERLQHELQVHQIELEMQNESLQQARISLEDSRDRYFDLYEFAPVGYLTLSDAGVIGEINLSGAALLGAERGKLLQRFFSGFVAPDNAGIWRAHLSSALKQEAKSDCELVLQRSDGTQIDVRVDSLRFLSAGQALKVRIVLTDISEHKRLEAERASLARALQEKNVELERARSEAEKANLAKSEFLSNMSHELRTPLNAILGFAQLMEAGSPPPTPSQQRSIEQILKGGWYLLELISEILDLALIESGRATLSREAMSLSELLLECHAMIEPQARQRGIEVSFPPTAIPYFVNADRTRLKQILLNLLSNAIKYNKPGGAVAVECSLSPPDALRISVRDSGVGLAAEHMAQLFQPFNRLGKEAGAEVGTGIGLVVTKRLVEMMGGAIGVDSVLGVGSVFWFELSLGSAPQITADSVTAESRPQSALALGRPQRTLLYVEDNPANLELVEQLVARRPDLRLLCAMDGNRGIELARIHLPEVILMDINLPGISGIEAMKILRADPSTAHIPIIALSANAVPRDIERSLDAGFFDYLTKPIRVPLFMDALDLALEFAKTAASGVPQN